MLNEGQEASIRETPCDRAQRHVGGDRGRFARQEVFVAKLDVDGRANMLFQAHRIIQELQSILTLAEEHLARELAKGPDNTPA